MRNANMPKPLPALLVVVLLVACKAPPFPAPQGDPETKFTTRPPPAGAATGGGFVVAEPKMDIGDVERGTWASATFVITNKSDRILHVKNVRGS